MTLMIRAEVGSKAYGTNTPLSDTDLVEVVVEPHEYITGLETFDTTMKHTAEDGARSTKDDTDTTVYGLHKFVELAAAGNPSILSVLFLGADSYQEVSPHGQTLIDNRDLFLSKAAVHRHLGYMKGQRDAMTGAKNKRTNRPELVHQFGYDTKFAYHMVRLGMLGYELAKHRTMTLPMSAGDVATLMDIRNGKPSKEDVIEVSYDLEYQIEHLLNVTTLPDKADREGINTLLHTIYLETWEN